MRESAPKQPKPPRSMRNRRPNGRQARHHSIDEIAGREGERRQRQKGRGRERERGSPRERERERERERHMLEPEGPENGNQSEEPAGPRIGKWEPGGGLRPPTPPLAAPPHSGGN